VEEKRQRTMRKQRRKRRRKEKQRSKERQQRAVTVTASAHQLLQQRHWPREEVRRAYPSSAEVMQP
jgi:hypothetical protein